MQMIPADILDQYSAVLKKRAIPVSYHADYSKLKGTVLFILPPPHLKSPLNTPTIFNVPPGNPGTVWTVFELDGISGTITPINRFGFESDSGNITSF